MAKILGTSLLNQKKLNELYVAGDNQYGIGDNNSSATVYSYTQVGASSDWSDISVFYAHIY